MTGTELVDLLIEHVGSELTRPKAIQTLNWGQNQLLATRRMRLMRILPDPFLTTTAGTYQYAASNALFSSAGGVKGATQWDIRDLGRLYALNGLQSAFAYGGHDQPSMRPLELENPHASNEVKAPADWLPSREALSADCIVTFWEDNDPGTTTIEWRAEAYRWPTQFTAESVALEVPEGFQDTLLLWKALQKCGVKQFGSPSRNIHELLKEELPAFFTFCSRAGGVSGPMRTLPRE